MREQVKQARNKKSNEEEHNEELAESNLSDIPKQVIPQIAEYLGTGGSDLKCGVYLISNINI